MHNKYRPSIRSGTKYAPAHMHDYLNHEQKQQYHVNDPKLNAYVDVPDYGTPEHPDQSKICIDDPGHPFYGMDPQLIGFLQKHQVVLDDGAVINKNAVGKIAGAESKIKKQFKPPGGLSFTTFIALVVLIVVASISIIIAFALGVIYGVRHARPTLPKASPWWRRTQFYQINIPTWANDVGGPVGRLQDVLPRITYLSSQIGATSIILTNLVSFDQNGIINWNTVSQLIDTDGLAFTTLLPDLVKKLKKRKPMQTVLGLPIYATSGMHEWFKLSQNSATSRYATFYLWTDKQPSTSSERRYSAYNSIRRAYYRHVHGNPDSPLLNLTNPDVQVELIEVIEFWRRKLKIKGVMITNSTNILPDMVPGIQTILNANGDNEFIWFADDPNADSMVNLGDKVCEFEITINLRVPTVNNDVHAQIQKVMLDDRLKTCSPIWKVIQLTENNKDFETIQKLAYFLPGSFLMMAGQEVDKALSDAELLKWSYIKYLDYTTYWPNNKLLPLDGKERLISWRKFWKKMQNLDLLNTPADAGTLVPFTPSGSENLLVIYRQYKMADYRAYFIVSFQTLNVKQVRFNSIFYDLNYPIMEIVYDSKHIYKGRRELVVEELRNNQILILYYY